MPLINSALKFLDCRRGTSERRNNTACKRGRWIRLLMGWTSETPPEILLSHRREHWQSGPCSGGGRERMRHVSAYGQAVLSAEITERGRTAEKGTSFRRNDGGRTGKRLIPGSRAQDRSVGVSCERLTRKTVCTSIWTSLDRLRIVHHVDESPWSYLRIYAVGF